MSSNGLPCQRFDFDLSEDILTESLRIMALDRADSEFPCWREYVYTDNLAAADPYDRCFTYDRERRELVFGDNENGEIPTKGSDNIMVISCEHTRGDSGRVIRGNLRSAADAEYEYGITQHTDAVGGHGRETLGHAMARLKLRMNDCVKAVTAEDYRTLAMRTPGIRIADVCAIPFFDPDIPKASEDKLVNTVTLAVLPYSADSYPVPDENFLTAVREHMENFRLITTQIKVVAPIYVRVDIFADVICGVREAEKARSMAEQVLRNMFSVYGRGSGGIRFGQPVSDVDVITEICAVDGILSVKQIQVSVDDSRCYRDKYGRIIIPPHAIPCCGKTEIRVAEA
jgi:predicted phage baseplate assembly protein